MLAGVVTSAVMIILFCCYKVLKKWIKEYDEYMRNNPRSNASENSEIGTSVQKDERARKANHNEGFQDEISVKIVKEVKTFSTENQKGVLHQLFSINSQKHKEANLGRTRVNQDGSMDTRF